VIVGSGYRRRRSWLLLGLAAAAVALVALVLARRAVERRALRRALPQIAGQLTVAGLEKPLVIVRDARGVPHVRAASERDAYFGLGFAEAQDRLAQMTWLVRAARGRTAEVLGRAGLPVDRWSRTLGFGRLGDARAAALDPVDRRLLDAYAAGVNAWIDRIHDGRASAPLPLARLGVSPEPWSAADCIAVEKLLAWAFDGSVDATLALGDLVDRLGAFRARPFFPPDAASELVPIPLPHTEARSAPAGEARSADVLRRVAGLAGRSIGSSAWVVSGRETADGMPLLAGDVHTEPTVPALLYQAQLAAPGLDVAGAGPAGVPVFWVGHNARVAWAATLARAVVTDVFVESLDPDDPTRYRTSGGWRRVAQRTEHISVRDGAAEELVVRETVHGPLVDGLLSRRRGALAVAWAGAESGDGVGSFLHVARSRDVAELRAALVDHQEPTVAVVFADVTGAAGRQVAGWVPKRGLATALVPVPGRSGWYDWRGRVPYDALPRATLTGAWLVAADNRLADEGPVEWWWRSGERAGRIEERLAADRARGALDATVVASLQADTTSRLAPERIRRVLALAGDLGTLPPEARHVVRILQGWDGAASADSRGAAAWHALLEALLDRVLQEPLGADLLHRYEALHGVQPGALLDAILDSSASPQAASDALVSAARLGELTREALRQTGLALRVQLGPNPEKWSWGRLHRLRFRAFGWPRREWGVGDDLPRLGFGGDGVTVAVAEYDLADPYDARVVAAYRLVVDLASPDLALSSLAPGESEHAGDPQRAAGVARWLAGEPGLLASHPFVVDEGARARLRLVPAETAGRTRRRGAEAPPAAGAQQR
jgi:penicillin amidase